MTVSTTYSIHCDGCSIWIAENETRKEALEHASQYGWKRKKVPNGSFWDLCPACQVKLEKGELR